MRMPQIKVREDALVPSGWHSKLVAPIPQDIR
jgi:hypothetical protein